MEGCSDTKASVSSQNQGKPSDDDFHNATTAESAGKSAAQLLNTVAYLPVCADDYGSLLLYADGVRAFYHLLAPHCQRNTLAREDLHCNSWQWVYGERPRHLVSLLLCLVSVKQL